MPLTPGPHPAIHLVPGPAARARALGMLEVVPPGRIVEICGGARASVGAHILSLVQARGEHVAWIAPRSAGLFPPDLAAAGLDLDALVVVHIPENDARAGPRAAELLLRTGAIGAVLLETSASSSTRGPILRTSSSASAAWQGRLCGVLREHDARLVLLSSTEASGESLGPLVSVRLALSCRRIDRDGPRSGPYPYDAQEKTHEVQFDRDGPRSGPYPYDAKERTHEVQFEISTRVTKDKSGLLAGLTPRLEVRRGPLGA